MLKLTNVTLLADYGCAIDLKNLKEKWPESKFDYSKFHGLIKKYKEFRISVSIFRTSKVIIVGSNSLENSVKCSKVLENDLKQAGFDPRLRELKIINLVGSCKLAGQLKVNSILRDHINLVTFEPELFNGLRFLRLHLNTTVTVFHTGSLIYTGSKSLKELEECHSKTVNLLCPYVIRLDQ